MRPWRAGEYMKHRALRIVPAYYTALWLVILVSDRGLLESAQGLGNIALHMGFLHIFQATTRSEERRVGKECRSRWSPYH